MNNISNKSESIYFSIADRQLECLISDEDAFDRSLFLNVLFQPSILIPDVFFFISNGIERHVLETPRQSLLEASLSSGIAIPSFRDQNCSSFFDILEILRGRNDPEHAIYGLRDSNSNKELAGRLQRTMESNDFTPAFWPKHDVSVKFEKLVTRFLAQTETPEIDIRLGISNEHIINIWELTEKWRIDCVNEAIKKTKQIVGCGLRRGILLSMIGESLGLPKGYHVSDAGELLALTVNSPKKWDALRIYLKWINGLYQYNQATEFKTASNFPSNEVFDRVIISQLLSSEEAIIDSSKIKNIKERIYVPPLNVLRDIDGSELIKIRNDWAPPYFEALSSWQNDPSDDKADKLRKCLNAYANEVVRKATKEKDFRSVILYILFGAQTTPNKQLFLSLVRTGEIATAALEPSIAPFLVLGEAGYALYNWYKTKAEETVISLKSKPGHTNVLPEVNISIPKDGNEETS